MYAGLRLLNFHQLKCLFCNTLMLVFPCTPLFLSRYRHSKVQSVPQVYLILLLQIEVEGVGGSVVAEGPLPLPAQFIE